MFFFHCDDNQLDLYFPLIATQEMGVAYPNAIKSGAASMYVVWYTHVKLQIENVCSLSR